MIISAVIIAAATMAMALAPIVTSNALALRNGGSVTTCLHNGNGQQVDCGSTNGNSAQSTTQYKCQGKFQSTPC